MNFKMLIRVIHTTNPPTLLQEGVSLSMSIVPVEPVLLLSVSESGLRIFYGLFLDQIDLSPEQVL